MKFLALIGAVVMTLAFAGCGGGSSAEPTEASTAKAKPDSSSAVSVSDTTPPKVHIPPGPPPNHLVVRDLKKGTGAAIKKGRDVIIINYVNVDYETGKEVYNTWDRGGPSKFHLDEVRRGLEIGLVGMKVGGRRVLTLPPRLAYGTGTLVYVVELVAVG